MNLSKARLAPFATTPTAHEGKEELGRPNLHTFASELRGLRATRTAATSFGPPAFPLGQPVGLRSAGPICQSAKVLLAWRQSEPTDWGPK